jgi:hypothetical protein
VDLSTRINLIILDIEAAHKTIEACPFKLLSFSGDTSEDLITFKGDFQNTTADNRISEKDQLGELRECLTGKAAAKLPLHGLRDIEEAWQFLQEAFGNTCANLNHKLSRIERTTGLTDKLVETNPAYAATWLLDYGNAVEEIINLGDQGLGLEALALDAPALYTITSKLPPSMITEIRGTMQHSKLVLGSITVAISKARREALARSMSLASNKNTKDTAPGGTLPLAIAGHRPSNRRWHDAAQQPSP